GGGGGAGRPVINFCPVPAGAAPAVGDVPQAPRVTVTALPALQQIRLDLPSLAAPQPDLTAGLRTVAAASVGGGQGPGAGGGAGAGAGPGAGGAAGPGTGDEGGYIFVAAPRTAILPPLKVPQPTMLIPLVLGLSVVALAVAVGLARWVLKQDNGTADMRKISDAIQEGAGAFLRRQYRTIFTLSVFLAVLIFVLYAFFRSPHPGEPPATTMAFWTTLSFVFGAVCSGIAGLIGMFVAVRANIRTASAARSSVNRALQIALRGGAVSGLFVVAMSLLGVGGLYAIVHAFDVVPP